MQSLDTREAALARLAASVACGSDRTLETVEDALAEGATASEIGDVIDTVARWTTAEVPAGVAERVADADRGPWTERVDVTIGDVTTVVAHREGAGGIPIVLHHSLGTDHRMWEPLVAALPDDVEVWAWDARNHGANRDRVLDFTVPLVAQDADAIFDHFGIGRALFAGISMGGAVAQEFAIRYQPRLAGLAIIATRGKGAATGEQRAAAGEREGIAAQIDRTLSRWFTPGYLAVNDGHVRRVRSLLLSWSVDAWARGWRALGATSTAGRLHDVSVPTICVAGEADTGASPATLQGIVDVLPDATLKVIPGGSHLFPMEDPERAAAVLLEHRASLDGS